MRVLILGGDGYLGWPTAMRLSMLGHEVTVVDNYLRRNIARATCSDALVPSPNLHDRAEVFHSISSKHIAVRIGDCADFGFVEEVFQQSKPETVIHYAEQPSAPYSMMGFREAQQTLNNNLNTTFNLIWAVIRHTPDCHIIKLGTMGEYGTPNIDIEEGWIEVEHNGRRDLFLFPRQASSLYHTTKILDTDLLWFYVRSYGIRVTDLMQGPVYGISTDEADGDERLMPNFHYDDIFGTVVNRFLVQAMSGIPLTVYGKGGQTRGYLNLSDTLQCIELALNSIPERSQLRILNQFTEQFSVNELAEKIKSAAKNFGLKVDIQRLENPRLEKEEHYYNAKHKNLLELGLCPRPMTEEVLCHMLEKIRRHKNRIDIRRVLPRVQWSRGIAKSP